ncbi:MAG: hypothetical protein LUI02_05695 [Clostridiales bacterium]|nr:hypothetical protein [Clostridiales bacterium]
MKKWIVGMAAFWLPLLAILIGVNFYVDSGTLFHGEYEEMAQAIMDGKCVGIQTSDCNERLLKAYMVTEMPKDPDCVVIGPSLTRSISAEVAGEEELYNLSVGGANYYDVLSTLGLMETYGIHPKRVILACDVAFFHTEIDERWEMLSDYAYYMLDVLDGVETEAPSGKLASNFYYAGQLFSLSYFQSAVHYVRLNGISGLGSTRIQIVDVEDEPKLEIMHFMPDGSYVCPQSTIEQTVEDVEKSAEDYELFSYVAEECDLPSDRVDVYEKILTYFEENGTEVELFLCPFSPSLWDRIDLDEYPLITELEDFAVSYADEHGLKLTGSLNPYNVGITDADYYDARHVRREAQGEYFDFTE